MDGRYENRENHVDVPPGTQVRFFFNLPVNGRITEFYHVYTVSIKRYSVVI